MSYSKEERKKVHLRIFNNLNSERQNAFDSIMESIDKDLGKQVLGNETYLWKTVRDALSRSLS
jgi:succinate dehydrogenase flavin-adding protein (antitoxin of CptAB toxin-antitoxin module)